MAKYRSITTSFWDDSKISENFTPEDRYIYLYLLTNSHTRLCGCYEITPRTIEFETGLPKSKVLKAIQRLDAVQHVIRYDSETSEVLILNWAKYQWTTSQKVLDSIAKELPYIHNKTFKEALKKLLEEASKENVSIDTLSIPYGYGIDTVSIPSSTVLYCTDTVKKGFKAPSVEEVRQYCKERKNKVDPEAFVSFYESKGWKVGNQPMKNWKSAVITWEKRNDQQPKARSGTTNKFHNFEERNYDLDALERLALQQ